MFQCTLETSISAGLLSPCLYTFRPLGSTVGEWDRTWSGINCYWGSWYLVGSWTFPQTLKHSPWCPLWILPQLLLLCRVHVIAVDHVSGQQSFWIMESGVLCLSCVSKILVFLFFPYSGQGCRRSAYCWCCPENVARWVHETVRTALMH